LELDPERQLMPRLFVVGDEAFLLAAQLMMLGTLQLSLEQEMRSGYEAGVIMLRLILLEMSYVVDVPVQ